MNKSKTVVITGTSSDIEKACTLKQFNDL